MISVTRLAWQARCRKIRFENTDFPNVSIRFLLHLTKRRDRFETLRKSVMKVSSPIFSMFRNEFFCSASNLETSPSFISNQLDYEKKFALELFVIIALFMSVTALIDINKSLSRKKWNITIGYFRISILNYYYFLSQVLLYNALFIL